MSPINDSLLLSLQTEVAALLRAEPLLDVVSIVMARDGDVASDIERKLTALSPEDSAAGRKRGASIIVEMPKLVLERDAENVPGPPATAVMSVACLENVRFNETGLTGETLAAIVLNVLHLHRIKGILGVLSNLYGSKDAATPLAKDEVRGYQVRAQAKVNFGRSSKVATPVIAIDAGGTVSITCATPGATIYWSVDGSPPFPGVATAIEYDDEAINDVELGDLVRAAAVAPDYLPSDSAAAVYE